MKPWFRKWLPWLLYAILYLFSLVVFAYFTFPFDSLRDRVILAFAEDQRKSGEDKTLEIDDLSSYWFSGVDARGVRLITPASVDPTGKSVPGSELSIERLTARVSILPLLLGRVTVSFTAQAFGGEIQGKTANSSKGRDVELELDDVALGDFAPLVEMVGLPLAGKASGTVNITLPEGKLSKATGNINLKVTDLAVGDGKAKIKDMIALPRLTVGEFEMQAEITEGVVKVTKFGASGHDLDLAAEGTIRLKDVMAQSQADLYLKFKFSDKYKGKDDKTKALFGAPGATTSGLFELDPKVKKSKRTDGFYGWRLWGMFKSPRFDPAPTGAVGPKSPLGKSSAGRLKGFPE